MRLRTRVLSFVLAGSMMLSATPVSVFAETPVLGEGTVSPTALSETNSTGTLAIDRYGYPYDSTKGDEYETNHHTMTVVSSDGSWAYQKSKNSQGDVYILVLTNTFSQDLTGQIINCQVTSNAPTLIGGTYNGFVQLGSTNQKSDASGCTFNAPVAVPAAGATLTNCTANHSVQCAAAGITLTNCTLNRNSADTAVLSLNKYDSNNSADGCSMTLNNCTVSCSVRVYAGGSATINGGTYNIPGSGAGIVANGAVHITRGEFTTRIDARENGSVTIDGGIFYLSDTDRKTISAFGGDITIKDGTFNAYLQAQSGSLTIENGTFNSPILTTNGNITIEDGTFTGPVAALSASSSTYTGVLSITGGVFTKEPQGATGSIYKLSAEGASFNDMASPVYIANQTAVPHIEITYPANSEHKVIAWRFDINNSEKQHGNSDATDPRVPALLAQANYTHSDDNRTISFDCVPSINYYGHPIAALTADTVFTPVLDVLPSELTFHAATENSQASVELGADMPADRIDVSCFYTNVATNEVSEKYPTEAGTYQISVILKAKGLSDDLKNNIYQNRVEWNGAYHQLSYANESTGNTLTSLTSENWRFQINTNTVTLTVNENDAPVIPADAKGVRYENNTLTIDANTTARFAQGTTVKCDIVNNGTLDGGLFTGTVTGSGSIARGLFLNKPEAALNTMTLSVPENASLNGITKPDATGLTTLYAINTLDGKDDKLLFIGDYIGDPDKFYGWDLVYSLGDEENSDIDYIGQKHFEQPMGTIPDGMNGVNCTFLPVLKMDASDLTITADKTESKINGAVIDSVQYVDASDPNAEPSTVYPTKAGSYTAIVTLTCPGDTTYSKARVARTGHLCYYVPETLEVPFEVKSEPVQPELSIVNGLPDTTGMEADAEGVYTSKNWSYNKNTNTLSVTNSSYFETFTGLVSCKVVAGKGVKISNGYFKDTVTFDGGTVDGGWFAKEPVGCASSDVHSIAYADGTTEFTVNNTLTVTKIWYGGTLKVNISTKTPIYSVGKNYLPSQTTSLTYTSEYPTDYVLNGLDAPVLSTFTLSGVTDAYVMLDKTYRLDMTDPQDLREGVKVTVKADACDADHQVEWVATGLELSEEQKHSAELTFTMPGNAVTLTATYPSIQPVQPELPTVPPTDGDGNVTIEGTDEVKGDGWTAKKEDNKTIVEITGDKDFNNATLNCDQITIGSNTTVSNITTETNVTVEAEGTIASGTFSGNVSGTGTIAGGTFSGKVTSDGEIKGGTFEKDVTTTGTITDGTFSGNVSGDGTITGGTFTGTVDSSVTVTGGVFATEPNTPTTKAKVTVTGGATVNDLKNNGSGENLSSTVTVVTGNKQTIQLSANIEGRELIGWKATEGSSDSTLIDEAKPSITIHENDETERTFTPVVMMNEKDLTAAGESKITGVTVTSLLYYPVNDAGEITGEGSAERPTEDGRYILVAMLELSSQEPSENGIALFAAENTDLSRVVEQDGIGYYVPESLTVECITNGEDVPSATGSGDSGAGGAAVAVIGGAAIGGAAYLIGTQVYLTSVLPEGASIPTNRQQLADLLWTAAGKPQPASTALFTDISADSQKAARWCVEQGLLKDTGSTFKPDKHTFRPQVIKAWNDLQARLNPQK